MVEVKEINVNDIIVPAERARATFTDELTAELEASIRTHGFTVPILVAPAPNGKYTLIDGEHRLQIAKKLGYTALPCVIAEADDKKLTLLNILANTARGTQNPMDVAEQLKKAHDAGVSDEELAAATGHTKEWVRFYLNITELPDIYKNHLRTGRLKVGHMREVLRLPTPIEIDSALQSTLIHEWTVEDLKYYVDRRLMDLASMVKRVGPENMPPPPTPQEAVEIVSYSYCLMCKRKAKRDDMRMPIICQDCYNFLEYFAEQFGDTKKALEILYEAYTFYCAYNAKMPRLELSPAVPEGEPVPTQGGNVPNDTGVSPQTKSDDVELAELLVKIKKLKESGLI